MNACFLSTLVSLILASSISPAQATEVPPLTHEGHTSKQSYNFFAIDEHGVERSHIIISAHQLTFKENLYLGPYTYQSLNILKTLDIYELPILVLQQIDEHSQKKLRSGIAYEVDIPHSGNTYYVIGKSAGGVLYLYQVNLNNQKVTIQEIGKSTGTTDLACVANLMLMPLSDANH